MHTTSTLPRAVDAQPAARRGRLVVDAPTRMFHWLFALSFVGAFVTADGERWRAMHVTLGYLFAGLLVLRLLYGLLGPRQVRLSLLRHRASGVRAWLRSLAQRPPWRVDWRQGENLLIALAIVAMMLAVVPLTLSGFAVYQEWSGDWLEDVHEFFGNAFLAVVLAHVGALAVSSLLRRRNRMLPMITGRIDGRGPDPVRHERRWLATLLLAASIAFVAWQWMEAPNGLVPMSRWHEISTTMSASFS
ncbi:MAG: cytochrome b/b6 domain-containing protein [Burkholderiaceae bacterium]|nr:cytochrome b/b6 domain-containing protein [Burkholderiaceae bacterium]